MTVSAQDRRDALRKRTKRGINERGQKGLGRKSVLDFSKAGDRKFTRYEIKSGKTMNSIDILPFEITNPEYKNLRSTSGSKIGLDVGFTDYKLEIPVHRGVGENNDVFLCPRLAFGKKCPICEDMYAEWNKDEENQNEKKINALKPSWRCFYNIYDYDGDGTPVQLWENVAYGNFEKVLQEAVETEEDGIVTFSDLEMGSTIEFKGRDKKFGKNPYIEAYSVSFKKREPYDESLLDETLPLDAMLVVSTYEQIAKAHLGMDEDDSRDNDDDDTETEPSSPKSRTRRRFEKAETEQEESSPPWNTCPLDDGEFGVTCNELSECVSCNEDLFQACAAKQDERREAEAAAAQTKGRDRTRSRERGNIEDKQPTASSDRRTRSRR